MRHHCRPCLPIRPVFLLKSQLPYDDLLKSPGRFAGGCMDLLSEVLQVVKLQGALFYNGEFSSRGVQLSGE